MANTSPTERLPSAESPTPSEAALAAGLQRRRTSRISIAFAVLGILAGLAGWGIFAWLRSGGASVRLNPDRVFAVFFWFFLGAPAVLLLGLGFCIVAYVLPRRSAPLATVALVVDLSLPMWFGAEALAGPAAARWFLGWVAVNTVAGMLVTRTLRRAARRRAWPVAAHRATIAATVALAALLILAGLVFLAL